MDIKERDEFDGSNTMLYFSLLVTCYLAIKVSLAVYEHFKVIQVNRKVKGLPGTRIIQGDCWHESYDSYFDHVIEFLQETGSKFHKVWVWFLYPVYSLNQSEEIRIVLSDCFFNLDHWFEGPIIPQPLIGYGLLSCTDGKQWKKRKKLISPAFSLYHVKTYIDTFNECVEDLLIRFSKERRFTSVEISKPVSVSTLDVLLRCAFSYDGNLQEHGYNHAFVQAAHRLTVLHKQRVRNPLLFSDFIYRRTIRGRQFKSLCSFIHGFIEKMIVRKVHQKIQQEDQLEELGFHKADLLDLLLTTADQDSELSYTDLSDEIISFIFTGHSISSSAVTWALFCLAKHPEIQTKVFEEIFSVIGDGEVEWHHLPQLKYLHCFILEVMRFYPVIPVVDCVLDKPLTVDDVTLRPGTKVQMNIHAANRSSATWDNPLHFQPDRFMVSSDDEDLLLFLPFSVGPRCCLGQDFAIVELKVFLSRILQTFQLELDTAHHVTPTFVLGCQPKTGVKVFIHSR